MLEIHPAIIWAVAIFVALNLAFLVVSWFVASYCAYTATLRRGKKEKWSREMPTDLSPEARLMYDAGLAWAAENADKKQDVHVTRDGFNLYGEYYDLGSDRSVMVLSGRTESLRYGYYFAIPYAKNGYNVLVVDPRAHGLSDGEYNTVGFEESRDAIEWVNLLVRKFGIRSVIFHGICIGAAGGVLALTSGNCPTEVHGIVTEGMFSNFYESVRNHMIEQRRPTFITLNLIDRWMRHFTGHTMKFGPIDVIDRLDVPLLMLHSREDMYSTPEYAAKLFERAGTPDKRIVWFEHGRHSMLRITDTDRYDGAISEFLASVNSTAGVSAQ